METKTHFSLNRRARIALSVLVSAVLTIPTSLWDLAAFAAGGTPGPVPSVTYQSSGPGSVTIAWTEPWTDGGSPLTDYRIDYREPGGRWNTFADAVSTDRTATITGLVAGHDYEVRVAATNINGDGPATVLGALTRLIADRNNVCGETGTHEWTCFGGEIRRKSVSFGSYPTANQDVAGDLIDFDGQCAVSASRGVLCGTDVNNRYGELGQGYLGGASGVFVVPGLPTDIVAVSSTKTRACALDSSGSLWCWGKWNLSSTNTTALSPTIVKRNVKQFEGDCARYWDDTVECVNTDGIWSSVPYLPTMSQIADDSNYTATCGITADRTVMCFDTIRKSFLAKSGWEDVVDLVDGSALCALIADGTVKCYGNNTYGELGNGTLTGGYSTVRLPEPAIAIASHHQWDSNSKHFVCATGVSGSVYCWGEWMGRFPSGLTTSTIPYQVNAPGAVVVQSMPAPGAVTGLEQSGRATHSVSVRWNEVPNTGRVPVDGYIVRWSTNDGLTWSTTVTHSTSWSSPYLEANSAVIVDVAAYNAAGSGGDNAITATTTYPPARPTAVRELSHGATSATIGWTRVADEDEPVQSYRVEWASDGETWHATTVAASQSSVVLEDLPSASAIEVRVRAENAAGISAWSDRVSIATSGLNPQTVRVTDSYGTPVIGGQITWVMASGAYRSAVDYGLTADGTVTFPTAPAGSATITLSDVVLPGGAVADYRSTQLFGRDRIPTIVLPAEPSRSTHTVRVVLPNGEPVMGATVSVESLDQTATVAGANFVTPDVVTSGVTNEYGEVYLVGYSNESTIVSVEYNDGVLIQSKSASLGLNDVSVHLDEMPWVDPLVDTTTVDVGDLVTVPVVSTLANAVVKVKAPKGAAQECSGRVLKARTNSAGTATLKLCAAKSGKYKVTGLGQVSVGVVTVRANGTKSLPVRRATAVSRSHQSATISWQAPAFTGGKAIKKYIVTLTSPTGKKIVKKVTSTSVTFTGLAGATTYKVTIVPTTKLGKGGKVVLKVPVS